MHTSTRPKLLLIHGAWHGAWCWEDEFAPYLRAQDFHIESINLPGHGLPGHSRINSYSINNYVDAIQTRLQTMGKPTVAIGHSMGGYALQKLMERQPEQLAGVVLMASATQRGVWGITLKLLRTQPVEFLLANLTLNLYRLLRSPDKARRLFHAPDISEKSLQRHWARLNNESFRAFLEMLLIPIRPHKADPSLPKLILGGEQDAVFPVNIIQTNASQYSTEAKIYPGMPHNLMQHANWQQVADDICAWLKRL